jgi:hypothetical protein
VRLDLLASEVARQSLNLALLRRELEVHARSLGFRARGLMWNRRALREGLRQAAWSTRSTVRLVAFVLSEAAAMRRAQAPIWGCAYFASSL